MERVNNSGSLQLRYLGFAATSCLSRVSVPRPSLSIRRMQSDFGQPAQSVLCSLTLFGQMATSETRPASGRLLPRASLLVRPSSSSRCASFDPDGLMAAHASRLTADLSWDEGRLRWLQCHPRGGVLSCCNLVGSADGWGNEAMRRHVARGKMRGMGQELEILGHERSHACTYVESVNNGKAAQATRT